ncbi:MAG: peptide chain release factor N(5)-glutamine methyltransferase, partial [Thermoplasmata archaeon]
VRVSEGSWFEALPERLRGELALVVSNPPYVAEAEVAELPEEVAAWEPMSSLVAGPTGLEALSALLEEAPRWLAANGVAVLEMAPHQQESAVALARGAGFNQVEVSCDLAGRPRVLVGRV